MYIVARLEKYCSVIAITIPTSNWLYVNTYLKSFKGEFGLLKKSCLSLTLLSNKKGQGNISQTYKLVRIQRLA